MTKIKMVENFCKRIDDEMLIEAYVAGKLSSADRNRIEDHVSSCEKHAQALVLEKAMQAGVRDYAREQLRESLNHRLKKRDEARSLVLRFAAIFLIVIILPVTIYYSFQNYSLPSESVPAAPRKESKIILNDTSENSNLTTEEENSGAEQGAEVRMKAAKSMSAGGALSKTQEQGFVIRGAAFNYEIHYSNPSGTDVLSPGRLEKEVKRFAGCIGRLSGVTTLECGFDTKQQIISIKAVDGGNGPFESCVAELLQTVSTESGIAVKVMIEIRPTGKSN